MSEAVAAILARRRVRVTIADLHNLVPQLRRTRTEQNLVYLHLPWWYLLSGARRRSVRAIMDKVLPAHVHVRLRPTLW